MRFLLSPAVRAILVRIVKLVVKRLASDATPPPVPAPDATPAPAAPKRKGFLKRLFSRGR